MKTPFLFFLGGMAFLQAWVLAGAGAGSRGGKSVSFRLG